MIAESLVISDTNIFLDLMSVSLLEKFFQLPCDIETTDFVIDEIVQPKQIKDIQNCIKSKKLNVITFTFEELIKINDIFDNSQNNTSMADCSVWYRAKETAGRLLTGDGKLRKSAEKDNVKVSGILYIFDNLVEYEIITKTEAVNSLKKLISINSRLPKGECEKRILGWKK